MAPRVAFFTDSFNEVNGVALTSRQFAKFARSRFYPFLAVIAGNEDSSCKRGAYESCQLKVGGAALQLEHDLRFDLLFMRHLSRLRRTLKAFKPDIIHVTGPGHMGMLGAILAHQLRVPLAASWHTNVHEFGARRLEKMLRKWGIDWPRGVDTFEQFSLFWSLKFYKLVKLLFAPNPELVTMLNEATGLPVAHMGRGVDVELFHPDKRKHSGTFTIGCVGRLSAEKNVRLFKNIDEALIRAGVRDYRFLIVGEGGEREWLRQNLPNADLPGTLTGEPLAEAYASMDVFVFPSETDTFGNVALEAQASGVPVIVSGKGGPKHLVSPGITGFVAASVEDYTRGIELLWDRGTRERMSLAAREAMMKRSWSAVFESVYREYARLLSMQTRQTSAPRNVLIQNSLT